MNETQKLDVVDQLLDYRIVRISEKDYEVRNPDALSPLDYQWMLRKYQRVHELEAIDELTDDDRSEYSKLLDRIVRIILNAPEEVHVSLSDLQRTQILLFFGNGSSKAQAATSRKTGQRNGSRSRGAKRSRA